MGNSASYKLTYFNIKGPAERIRLAFAMQGIEFEDERIEFKDWAALKPKIKYGQMPVLTITAGEKTRKLYQSENILRHVARLDSKTLYPTDIELLDKVEESLGVVGDFQRAWTPCLYISMRPQNFGYAEGFSQTDEGKATIQRLRESFVANELPKYMAFVSDLIGKKKFLCGDHITIADLTLVPFLQNFQAGFIDFVPTTCLDSFTDVTAYMKRVLAVDPIKAYYTPKDTESKDETSSESKDETSSESKDEKSSENSTEKSTEKSSENSTEKSSENSSENSSEKKEEEEDRDCDVRNC